MDRLPAGVGARAGGVSRPDVLGHRQRKPLKPAGHHPSFLEMLKPGMDFMFPRNGPQNFGELLGMATNMLTPPPPTPPPQAPPLSAEMLQWALSQPGVFPAQGATVYHGTPHTFAPVPENPFGKFDLSKIGTGEGAQAYGHGIYLAENPAVARNYQNAGWAGFKLNGEPVTPSMLQGGPKELAAAALSRFPDKKSALAWIGNDFPGMGNEAKAIIRAAKTWGDNPGTMYRVDLPDEYLPRLLDWDAPLSRQPGSVAGNALRSMPQHLVPIMREIDAMGSDIYGQLQRALGGPRNVAGGYDFPGQAAKASEMAAAHLGSHGIPGLKYFDQGSRAAGQGTRNFVIWDPSILRILGVERP